MYYNVISFAPEPVLYTFDNVQDAIMGLSNINIIPQTCTLKDITLKETGELEIAGRSCNITKKGFEDFLKVLGIPVIYAKRVPYDVLIYDIRSIQQLNSGMEVTVLWRNDVSVSTIIKKKYSEISYSSILDTFVSKPIKKIQASEDLMKISFVFKELSIPDQNLMFVGEFLYASLTSKKPLQICAGLYKIDCENSFIMPLLGKVVANYLKPADIRLLRFFDTFECYDSSIVSVVFDKFSKKKDSYLTQADVVDIWKKTSSIFSKVDADLLFGFDENTRNYIINNVNAYKTQYKKAALLGQELPLSPITPFTYYEIANKITTAAHTRLYNIWDQTNAELLGGSILQKMIFSKN
jgi:hypothetical protein